MLDALLIKLPGSVTTGFNRLKQAPGPATPKTVRLWNTHPGQEVRKLEGNTYSVNAVDIDEIILNLTSQT